LYVSKNYLDEKPEVRKFVDFLVDPKHGTELICEVGDVPFPEQAFELAQKNAAARKTGPFFHGGSKIGVTIEELLASEG
jgi:phosphate transport system substrate-binding protein